MTRFARAKGSKSSNERVPEQATSWRDMRRDLHRESVRKAAVEQIERESHIERHQIFDQTTPQTSGTRKAVTEPVELVPFDDVPCFSGQSIQASTDSRSSITQKAVKKTKIQEVVRKKRPHPESYGDSEGREHDQSICKIQMDESVRLGTVTSDAAYFQTSELVASRNDNKRMDDRKTPRLETNSKNNGFNPTLTTSSKQKPHHQKKPSKGGECSEPKIGGNFKGYPVPVEDAETLTDAYNILRKEGLTHKQAMERIKPERRRAEKRLIRLKSTICFRCRKPGHRLSECPLGGIECDVCFKCGSTTHKYQDCKKKGSFVNAKCFICGVVGHLSARCPENTHGVYPEGGECKICGEKSHLVKDCPQNKNKKEHHPGTTEFDDYFNEKSSEPVQPKKKKLKKVQF